MSKFLTLCVAALALAGCANTGSSTSFGELRAEQLHQQRLAEKTAPYFRPKYDNSGINTDRSRR